jgi:hypothetical protein
MVSAGRSRPEVVVSAGTVSPSEGRSRSLPDLWDTNPDHVFRAPDAQSNPAPNGQDQHTKEVRLKDHSGHLRPPTDLLIALVTALATVVLLTAVMLVRPR